MMMRSTNSMMMAALFAFSVATEIVSAAYVPTAGKAPFNNMPPQSKYKNRATATPVAQQVLLSDSDDNTQSLVQDAPWRIALNIGNKPGYFSSTSWPIVVKCDFSNKDGSNTIIPQQDNIRYTVQTGEVVKPIQKGQWSLDKNIRNLAFTLSFPESMARNDLTINAGTTITCEGTMYTTSDLKQLNDNFYEARDKAWELGAELNDMVKQKDGPKNWNEKSQQWEKRNGFEQPMAYFSKRLLHGRLQQKQKQENDKRPDPKTLSAYSGNFPGIQNNDKVFIANNNKGIIKKGTQVIGTWSAEPITDDRPASYIR